MSLSSLTLEAVLNAMTVFDRDLRGTAEWEEWHENRAHKYAIEHDGQHHPVKKIASLASGISVSEFSGGEIASQANEFLRDAGFKIVGLRPSIPDWVRDELILALNVYLDFRLNPKGKESKEIIAVSRMLNRLGERLFPAHERLQTFRNENGVYMKLMNFAAMPQYALSVRAASAR